MIWLLRHGDAARDNGGGDAARPLTEKGRGQANAAGRALAKLDVGIDICLTSPRVRAAETARLACAAVGVDVASEERLSGGGFDPVELAAGRGAVLLVGHEPDISSAVAAMTRAHARIRKGGLAAVKGSELRLLLGPKELALIAGQ